MPEEIASEVSRLLEAIAVADDAAGLEKIRLEALGRKGIITAALKSLGGLPPEARRSVGQEINSHKTTLQNAIEAKAEILHTAERDARMKAEALDVSLPPQRVIAGKLHPISQVIAEVTAIFADMGFSVAEGPDIESDELNFTALNFPPDHPAREMHDTFYMADSPEEAPMVLRTHTSPVQVRALREYGAPIRVIAPGRTYRSDHDMTHSPMFHQIEGVMIDKSTHFAHLKGCLHDFCRAFFELDNVPLRFRPSFFPFTEPSAEVDIGCSRQDGRLIIGSGADWMEILGCGMMHPNVIASGGLDPAEYQGFAFGMGVERLAMLKYGMPDLRPFFDGEPHWTRHYGFPALETPSPARGLRI